MRTARRWLAALCIALLPAGTAEALEFTLASPGDQPAFFWAGDVALDAAGNSYVVDINNSQVVKLDPDGVEILRIGSFGSGDGQFNRPYGVAVGAAGRIYVADTFNSRLQVLNPDGSFHAVYGSAGTGDGQFLRPYDVTFDGAGRIYVADEGLHHIEVLNPDGTFYAAYGSVGYGDGEFSGPTAVAVDGIGRIYAADAGNHRIQILNPDGTFLAAYGGPYAGSSPGHFAYPNGIAVDAAGRIYVADSANGRIQILNLDGTVVAVFGSFGSDDNQFLRPRGIVVDAAGRIHVADTDNDRIKVLDPDVTFFALHGSSGTANGLFNNPKGIAVDGAGLIYVADEFNHRIQVLNPDGTFRAAYGTSGTGDGQLNRPQDVSVDAAGRIYVADMYNHRIEVLNPDGSFHATIGSQGSGNGQFLYPTGVLVANTGLLYVADTSNHRIQVLNLDGTFVTAYGTQGSGEGEFNFPGGLAMDAAGRLYVVDIQNDRIQVLNPDGTFYAVFDASGLGQGEFLGPADVAVDGNGLIYVADGSHFRIVVFNPDGTLHSTSGTIGGRIGEFYAPNGIAVDVRGRVYVADSANNRIQTTNAPPTLDPIADRELDEGATLDLSLTAVDPEGAPVAFSATGLPAFCQLTDHLDGTAGLACSPVTGEAGTYADLTVTADDGFLGDSEMFTLTVHPAEVCDGTDNNGDGQVDEGFADTDSDGQADCVDTDDDGDGYMDADEMAAGSDPLDPTSTPATAQTDPITWTDLVGVSANGGSLAKTVADGWGNGGAASVQSISGDGGVVFTATETDTSRMVGLSSTDANAHFNTIGYAIFARAGGEVRVFENGTNRGTYGAYQSGDELGVRRTGSTIEYTLNGVVIYTSAVPSSGDLIADAALYHNGATITDAQILTPPAGPPEVCDGIDNNGNGQIDEGFADTDGDGQADCVDTDDDNDGLTDTDETGIYGTNPLVADTDGDGLTDGDEIGIHGTDPLDADSDGDGYTDGQEIAAGSDPNDPDDVPAVAPGDPVVWADLVGVATGGAHQNTLTKTAGDSWGNGGAASVQSISGDGGVSFIATETGTSRMVGLSSTDADASFNTIGYAIFARAGGEVRVFENGTNRGTYGTYQGGDELGVRRTGGTIEYTRNGAVIYTSAVPSSGALIADAALYHNGATVTDARIVAPPPPPVQDVLWTDLVGVATSGPSGNGLTKTAGNGWGNGGAASVQGISGDGGVSFTATETGTSRMLGFSPSNASASFNTIAYAIFARAGGEVRVFENGTNRGTYGTYQGGDELGVRRTGGTIEYTLNGVVIYTSAVPSSGDLIADAALYHNGATITNAVIETGAPPPDSWTATGSMAFDRQLHTATLLESGKVLVVGGINSGTPGVTRPVAELYDPATGSFSPTGTMLVGRSAHTATRLFDGTVLVAGGMGPDCCTVLASAELYDPVTGLFSSAGTMTAVRAGQTATLLADGRVLLAGGQSPGGPLDSAEIYDPATGAFSPTSTMTEPRYRSEATLLQDGTILITGGYKGNVVLLDSAEVFDPVTGVFTATQPMTTIRYEHTATLLEDGSVLVVMEGTAELYDPASGSFTATGSPTNFRTISTATLLPNGKVLVAGGFNFFSNPLPSADLYDPGTGVFASTAGEMVTPRYLHTETLLPNGRVLVVGGHDANTSLASAELYTP